MIDKIRMIIVIPNTERRYKPRVRNKAMMAVITKDPASMA
jgi:hypothetical protein